MVKWLAGAPIKQDALAALARVGHTAEEMVNYVQWIKRELGAGGVLCNKMIVSGGLQSFLDGYYFIKKLPFPALYGQAAPLLKYAQESYELLEQFISWQLSGWQFAETYLQVK